MCSTVFWLIKQEKSCLEEPKNALRRHDVMTRLRHGFLVSQFSVHLSANNTAIGGIILGVNVLFEYYLYLDVEYRCLLKHVPLLHGSNFDV